MVSITVQAMILALAFGVCIADMANNKCKYDNSTDSQHMQDFQSCLTETNPSLTLANFKTGYDSLSDQDKQNLAICVAQKCGVMGADQSYNFTLAKKTLTENLSDDTAQSVKDNLSNGIDKCAQKFDGATDGVGSMTCVNDVFKQVCFGK